MKQPRMPFVSVFALAVGMALGLPSIAAPEIDGQKIKQPKNNVWIVRMAESPAVAYKGEIPGLKATKPAKNQKIDPNSPDVVKYTGYLESRHDATVAQAGGRKVYSYKYSFNGFAAELSDAQAQKLLALPGVLSVEKDEARPVDTATTPTFLGLTASGGLWSRGALGKGEGVIVGIVDGGIWPEHPSFSDRTGVNGNATQDGKLGYHQIPGWHGKCVPGDAFNASHCSQKIIGAQYFNAGWGGNAGISAQLPWEYNSPRDFGGHGTHTASTAAGNEGVGVTGPAAVFGTINGIAPRARVAVYKVCFQTPTGGSCFSSDSVAAIDTAVADGVDVINYSISGSRTNFRDSVEIAFMFAADAGVFVAASAGNSGPTVSTVAHPGPWLTTVAAGTHNRGGLGSVTLGNGAIYSGASLANAVGPAPFVDAITAGLPGANATQVRLCYSTADTGGVPVLDPAKIAGRIVLCERGVIARVNKSLAVKDAGGVGMVLVNLPPPESQSLNADFHFVPSVHLQSTDLAAIRAYAAGPAPTATIARGAITLAGAAPFTASFSSRGPLLAGGGDLLKPDIIAPGQDILAAVAPPGNGGRLFDLYSGTSMSSPHIAGLAAIYKSLKPSWSPMMIKSALMTTAGNVLDGPNTSRFIIERQGAGHVRPNNAADPGLVFDANLVDWMGFLCGTQLPRSFCDPSGIPVLDPSNLNVASIGIGDLAGKQVVTRRVTNVGNATSTYKLAVTGLSGINVTAADFTIARGATKTVEITFERAAAALNTSVGGQLTWSDGTHSVRIPAVIKPVSLAAPAQVSGTGAPFSYGVKFGYNGAFGVSARGLVEAALNASSVEGSGGGDFQPVESASVKAFTVAIPAGTTYARFALFDSDIGASNDLDLYVYLGSTPVGASGGSTSNEEVNLANPAAGTYTVYVHGFGTAAPSANFNLHSWALGGTNAGNVTVSAPSAATIGGTGTVTITPSDLTPGRKYLGSVVYSGSVPLPGPTILRVDP